MKTIQNSIKASIAVKTALLANRHQLEQIQMAAAICVNALQHGGKILLCGNGGSAADAQHIAAELTGRFRYDRPGLPAEALHTNTSYLTAVANDYGYEMVYSRMVEAVGREGDVLIGLSTSGNSANVVIALEKAKEIRLKTIGLCGNEGGKIEAFSDVLVKVPSSDTARVQEVHILIGHIICEIVESTLFPRET